MLKWTKEPSYYFGGDDVEYAWIEGSRDFHWAVDGGTLAVFDNEYDRSMVLSQADRTQEETKAVAQSIQNIFDCSTPSTALEWTQNDDQSEITPQRLSDALQSAWNEWIADTHSTPGCFTVHGPSTTMLYADFTKEPNFTSSVVDHLRHTTPAIHSEQSSVFDDDDAIPDDIIAELKRQLAESQAEVTRMLGVNRSWMDESESLRNTVHAMRTEVDKWRDKYLNDVGVRSAAERSRDEAVAALIRSERGNSK